MKTTNAHVISCFYKLFKRVSRVHMTVDQLKEANLNKLLVNWLVSGCGEIVRPIRHAADKNI